MADFSSNGAALYYEIHGEGTPIILLHGACVDFNFNYAQTGWIDSLNKQGYQVIGLDFRGHGNSEKSTNPSFYGLNNFSNDVVNLIHHLNLTSVAVMGYSMGTVVALNLLHKHPQLFTKAVLVATGDTLIGKPPFQKVIEVITTVLTFDSFPSHMPKHISAYWSFINELGLDKEAIKAFSEASYPSLTAEEVAEIQVPTFVLSGQHDLVLRQGKQTASILANGSYAEVEDADHFSLAINPGTHQKAVEFLKEN